MNQDVLVDGCVYGQNAVCETPVPVNRKMRRQRMIESVQMSQIHTHHHPNLEDLGCARVGAAGDRSTTENEWLEV